VKKYTALIVCAIGMSSSLLEAKAVEAAQNNGAELDISSCSTAEVGIYDFKARPVDIVLVAPQVRFKKRSIAQLVNPLGIVVEDIDPVTYGMVDGDKLFAQIARAVKKPD